MKRTPEEKRALANILNSSFPKVSPANRFMKKEHFNLVEQKVYNQPKTPRKLRGGRFFVLREKTSSEIVQWAKNYLELKGYLKKRSRISYTTIRVLH